MEFKQWIETLDTLPSFRPFGQSDGMLSSYIFVLVKTPQGLVPEPRRKINPNGGSFKSSKELGEALGQNPEDIRALRFEVFFDPARPDEYPSLKDKIDLSKVVEMHFSRQESRPKIRLTPVGARVIWIPQEEPRGDDAGDMSASDALKVFSNIAEIAKEYVKNKNPDGIIIGTGSEAKQARSNIYQRMVKRLLGGMGQIFNIGEARNGLKNSTLVWLKGNN